jgi:hypothetical protein
MEGLFGDTLCWLLGAIAFLTLARGGIIFVLQLFSVKYWKIVCKSATTKARENIWADLGTLEI